MNQSLHFNNFNNLKIKHKYQRYKFLFDNSPVPIHETNVTNVSAAIAKLKALGIVSIESYIAQNPTFISDLFYNSDIFDVNEAMLKMTEADSKSYYLENFKIILGDPCFHFFQAIVISAFYGKYSLTGQTQITTFKGNKIWIEATAMFLTMEGEEIVNYSFKEITEQKLKADAIELINTRLGTGSFQEHLNNLVLALSEAFNLSHVFIGKPTEDGNFINTLAFSENQQIIDNVTYNLKKSPCYEIYTTSQKVIYTNHLDKIYSENNAIQVWGGKSYVGYPLFNKKREIIGHFAFVNNKAIKNLDALQDVMELYAAWTSTELEHIDNQKQLQQKATTIETQLFELNKKNIELEKYIESNMQLENFAYIASHDLKAPIRTIISFSQLLERNLKNKLDKNGKEYLDFIVSASRNMKDLIEDLLAYSRINNQPIRSKALSVENLLLAITSEIRTTINEKKAIVQWKNLPSLINGDLIKLKQLFQNLITNAIKFQKIDTQPIITISCKETETAWQFSIQDNGIGIEPQYFERVFSLFQKIHLKSEYEGTGLGLAICKKIIAQHRGEIWVASEFGQGTTFYFTISK